MESIAKFKCEINDIVINGKGSSRDHRESMGTFLMLWIGHQGNTCKVMEWGESAL